MTPGTTGGGPVSPVVVLTYAHGGAASIHHLLSGSPALACTSGTGLLPACDQAAAAWRNVASRDGTLPVLAVTSIRALADTVITTILAGAGGSRWCEVSFSPPGCAETFLRLYPAAQFLCLHRSCLQVIRAGIEANPWGLAGTPLGKFASAHPGSSAAAIAEYWASCTESLLKFEEAHPGACRRIRYEDLASDPRREAESIFAFLRLAPGGPPPVPSEAGDLPPAADGAGLTGRAAGLLAGQIPPPLTARINDLQARIGHPPLPAADRGLFASPASQGAAGA